jgi:hypothetical protein
MTLKELLAEKGQVYRGGVLLDTEDVRHRGKYNGETHGEMLRVLEEFYDEYHVQIYEYQTELLEKFLENKNN